MQLKSTLISILLLTSLSNISYASVPDTPKVDVAKVSMEEADNAYKKGDYKMAFKEFSTLAESGDTEAQYKLANMYSNGEGILRDRQKATKWYLKAAKQGYSEAQYGLGVMHIKGSHDFLKDYKEAAKWYQKSAKQGHPEAQYGLGFIYINSKGDLKNIAKAKFWIKKAYENKKSSEEIKDLAEDTWAKHELWKY
jgi:TPR repeat protein